jgi:hypothetical protein
VESASARLAAKYHNDDYAISLSRLSDIETKGVLPNVYRLYSLAIIYRRDFRELLSFYGIDLSQSVADLALESWPHGGTLGSGPLGVPFAAC